MKSISYEKRERKGENKEWLEKAAGLRCVEMRKRWRFVCPMPNNDLCPTLCIPPLIRKHSNASDPGVYGLLTFPRLLFPKGNGSSTNALCRTGKYAAKNLGSLCTDAKQKYRDRVLEKKKE